MSIQCMAPGFELTTSRHEPPPITTIPGTKQFTNAGLTKVDRERSLNKCKQSKGWCHGGAQ